jgi:hypothetical protein
MLFDFELVLQRTAPVVEYLGFGGIVFQSVFIDC